MGQYALGYYSPPGKPGTGPNIAPPQYALGHGDVPGNLGSPDDLESIVTATGNTSTLDGVNLRES